LDTIAGRCRAAGAGFAHTAAGTRLRRRYASATGFLDRRIINFHDITLIAQKFGFGLIAKLLAGNLASFSGFPDSVTAG
jgi:hypothetical protein